MDVRALLAALDLVIVSHGLVLIALKRAADEAGHSSASGIEQLELVAVRASHMGVAVDFAVREGDVYFHLIVGQVPGDEERAARDFELFVVLYSRFSRISKYACGSSSFGLSVLFERFGSSQIEML